MSTRIFSLALLIALAACHSEHTPSGDIDTIEAAQSRAADDSGLIACAPAGQAGFQRICGLDRQAGKDGLVLTVRNPDGAFHRLLVTRDGRGVVAADGAERANVSVTGPGEIEVGLGRDRYRLPATVKPGAGRS